MRKTLKRLLPDHQTVSANRWLRPFASTLLHPRLWHLNRHSAAGAVAVGMFCGLIPGPLQMMGAAICCVLFRVNLPLALITTLYSNPLTIVPLYVLAFGIGSLILGNGDFDFTPPPDLVEPAIALSVVLAALNNLLGIHSLKRWRLAFVFGLVHGFGFASVLLDLGLPASALVAALGGFNVGVELGQLAIVGVFLPIAWLLRHTRFYRWVIVAGGSAAIVVLGLFWTLDSIGWLD